MTAVQLTLEEFLAQPETKPYREFASGQAFQKPFADAPHAAIQAFFCAMLYQFLAHGGLGRAFIELSCIFGPPRSERVYVPDLVVVSADKLPFPRYLETAPDLAVEVLSPDQHKAQFVDKIQFYLLYGVRLVWVIDPETRTITVQTPGHEGRILSAGDTLDGGDVLPGFELAVDDIFAQGPL